MIDELAVDEHGGMGIRQFSRQVVKPYLLDHYKHWIDRGLVQSFGDPAGNQRAQTDETTCIMELQETFNKAHSDTDQIVHIYTATANTNSYVARHEALSKFLVEKVDGEPRFELSIKAKRIRKGLKGKYNYRRIQVSGDERYTDVPDKNIYSHICEALQYAALMCRAETLQPKARENPHAKRIDDMLAGRDPNTSDDFEDWMRSEYEPAHNRPWWELEGQKPQQNQREIKIYHDLD